MKNILLNNKLTFVLLLVFSFSCEKEPCINIEELDELSKETKEWYTDENIEDQTMIDQNGVSQTLKVFSIHKNSSAETYRDNCGNSYGSFNFSIQYQMSISPINFDINVRGDALPEDGFYLELSVNDNNNNSFYKTTTYDFRTKCTRQGNAKVEILNQYLIDSVPYNDVMKITFNSANSNQVKTVFYAKKIGIIKFIKGNGNEFQLV